LISHKTMIKKRIKNHKKSQLLIAICLYLISIVVLVLLTRNRLIDGVLYIFLASLITFLGGFKLATFMVGTIDSQTVKSVLIVLVNTSLVLIGLVAALGVSWALTN